MDTRRMTRKGIVAVVASAALAAAAFAAPPSGTTAAVRIPDEYLIRFKADSFGNDREAAVKLAQELVQPLGGAVREMYQHQLTAGIVVRAYVPDEKVSLLRDVRIESIEPVRMDHGSPPPTSSRARIIP